MCKMLWKRAESSHSQEDYPCSLFDHSSLLITLSSLLCALGSNGLPWTLHHTSFAPLFLLGFSAWEASEGQKVRKVHVFPVLLATKCSWVYFLSVYDNLPHPPPKQWWILYILTMAPIVFWGAMCDAKFPSLVALVDFTLLCLIFLTSASVFARNLLLYSP